MRIAYIALIAVVVVGCGDDDSKGASCARVEEVVTKCFDDFCGGAGTTTSFCKCWSAGQDISVQTCACVPRNLDAVCSAIDPSKVDVSNYNCSGASDAVSHICN